MPLPRKNKHLMDVSIRRHWSVEYWSSHDCSEGEVAGQTADAITLDLSHPLCSCQGHIIPRVSQTMTEYSRNTSIRHPFPAHSFTARGNSNRQPLLWNTLLFLAWEESYPILHPSLSLGVRPEALPTDFYALLYPATVTGKDNLLSSREGSAVLTQWRQGEMPVCLRKSTLTPHGAH